MRAGGAGRNFGTLAALILMAAPVRGLRPVRAARLGAVKVPNPVMVTVLPFFRLVLTAPINASSDRDAAASAATASESWSGWVR